MKMPVIKDLFYVGLQGVFFLMYFIPMPSMHADLNENIIIIGWSVFITGVFVFVLALLQLNKNLTPFPTPIKGGKLIKNGLYKYVRHPIYSGLFLSALGYGVWQENIWKMLISIALLLLFYFKSLYEERILKMHYADYEDYIKKTKRFLPFF